MQARKIKKYKGAVKNIRESIELTMDLWIGSWLSEMLDKKEKAPLAESTSVHPLSRIFWK